MRTTWFCHRIKIEINLFDNAVLWDFTPVRLEFLAHVFCDCCGKNVHIPSVVAVWTEDSERCYSHVTWKIPTKNVIIWLNKNWAIQPWLIEDSSIEGQQPTWGSCGSYKVVTTFLVIKWLKKITCLKVYINNNLTVYSLYVIVYQTQLFMTQV